jgi:hypothetical protein
MNIQKGACRKSVISLAFWWRPIIDPKDIGKTE